MELPQPRVALGLALRGMASSAIDCQRRPARRPGPHAARSGVGAASSCRRPAAQRRAGRAAPACSASACCAGGDDYELLFTAAPRAPRCRRGAARRRGRHAHRPHRRRRRGCVVMDGRRPRRSARRAASTTSHERPLPPIPARCPPPPDAAPRDGALHVRHPAHWIALGFGSGLSPKAPGTVGTLWAWLAFLVLDRWLRRRQWARSLIAALAGVGWWACTRTAPAPGRGRPGRHRLGRGGRVLDRAVAADAGGLLGAGAAFACSASSTPPSPARWAGPTAASSCRRGQAIGWAQGFGILFDDLVAALLHAAGDRAVDAAVELALRAGPRCSTLADALRAGAGCAWPRPRAAPAA
jgi:phosphatidylglycerophosphatase A